MFVFEKKNMLNTLGIEKKFTIIGQHCILIELIKQTKNILENRFMSYVHLFVNASKDQTVFANEFDAKFLFLAFIIYERNVC